MNSNSKLQAWSRAFGHFYSSTTFASLHHIWTCEMACTCATCQALSKDFCSWDAFRNLILWFVFSQLFSKRFQRLPLGRQKNSYGTRHLPATLRVRGNVSHALHLPTTPRCRCTKVNVLGVGKKRLKRLNRSFQGCFFPAKLKDSKGSKDLQKSKLREEHPFCWEACCKGHSRSTPKAHGNFEHFDMWISAESRTVQAQSTGTHSFPQASHHNFKSFNGSKEPEDSLTTCHFDTTRATAGMEKKHAVLLSCLYIACTCKRPQCSCHKNLFVTFFVSLVSTCHMACHTRLPQGRSTAIATFAWIPPWQWFPHAKQVMGDENQRLSGDFSKPFLLPLVRLRGTGPLDVFWPVAQHHTSPKREWVEVWTNWTLKHKRKKNKLNPHRSKAPRDTSHSPHSSQSDKMQSTAGLSYRWQGSTYASPRFHMPCWLSFISSFLHFLSSVLHVLCNHCNISNLCMFLFDSRFEEVVKLNIRHLATAALTSTALHCKEEAMAAAAACNLRVSTQCGCVAYTHKLQFI